MTAGRGCCRVSCSKSWWMAFVRSQLAPALAIQPQGAHQASVNVGPAAEVEALIPATPAGPTAPLSPAALPVTQQARASEELAGTPLTVQWSRTMPLERTQGMYLCCYTPGALKRYGMRPPPKRTPKETHLLLLDCVREERPPAAAMEFTVAWRLPGTRFRSCQIA